MAGGGFSSLKVALCALLFFTVFTVLSVSAAFIAVPASALSQAEDSAVVTLNVVNRPPRVVDIVVPASVFPDSEVSCIPIVDDEIPSAVSVRYFWTLNGRPISETKSVSLVHYDTGKGDVIECTLFPRDSAGQQGEQASRSMVVESISIGVLVSKAALNAMGIPAGTDTVNAVADSGGLTAITGLAYSETASRSGENLLSIAVVILALLFIINLRMYVKHRAEKH